MNLSKLIKIKIKSIMTLSRHDEDILEVILGNGSEKNGIPVTEATALEVEAIKLAEDGKLEDAIASMTRIIESYPDNPSPYNNRAQIYRLSESDEEARRDLDKCLELCKDAKFDSIKRQALVQIGWLEFKAGGEAPALAWFEEAARLGSIEGKRMATRCNPYAAMCNRMLREVLASKFYSVPEKN